MKCCNRKALEVGCATVSTATYRTSISVGLTTTLV
jgi:hypothetical protein